MNAVLSSLAIPPSSPWADRIHPERGGDPRSPYARDRDRILHCRSFRQLQYKTQVYIVSDGDYYRTRITHSLEVAQLGRSLARSLGLCEDLAEAIALAHDAGHTPFGHAGEQKLDELLKRMGVADGWNSNTHSLHLLDHLEFEDPSYAGLNLTFATRQGIARHQTPFDQAATWFDDDAQPTLEAQVANAADLLAYIAHDIEDAVFGGLLSVEDIQESQEPALRLWRESLETAHREFTAAAVADASSFRHGEGQRRMLQRARRHFINSAVVALDTETKARITEAGVSGPEDAGRHGAPLVAWPASLSGEFRELTDYLLKNVYQSPLVARQNHREGHVLERVFEALAADGSGRLLPYHHRVKVAASTIDPGDRLRLIAAFVASLSDRALQDLYAELFDPRERSMHRPT